MEHTQTSEAPLLVSTKYAAEMLGVSSTYIAALKKARDVASNEAR
jgi:hypothetical protein